MGACPLKEIPKSDKSFVHLLQFSACVHLACSHSQPKSVHMLILTSHAYDMINICVLCLCYPCSMPGGINHFCQRTCLQSVLGKRHPCTIFQGDKGTTSIQIYSTPHATWGATCVKNTYKCYIYKYGTDI